jgi:hypothetical protein
MLTKKTGSERFAKVLMKLTPVVEQSNKIDTPRLPSQSSFLKELSSRSDKSTKYTSQLEPQTPRPMDESRAIKILL